MTYPRDVDPETPVEDAAEQSAEVYAGDDDDAPAARELSVETPEWDAQEQSEIVRGEDDEYR